MAKKRLCSIVLLVSAVILLFFAGVAYGRYSSMLSYILGFRSADISLLQLHGVTEHDARLRGEWTALSSEWDVSVDCTSSIGFCVSNGSSATEHCKDTVRFRMYVTATSGFDPDDAKIFLVVSEGLNPKLPDEADETFKGVCQQIVPGTSLYDDVGNGYLYRFYDADGKELYFELSGNELSTAEMMIRVIGDSDISLIRFSIIP